MPEKLFKDLSEKQQELVIEKNFLHLLKFHSSFDKKNILFPNLSLTRAEWFLTDSDEWRLDVSNISVNVVNFYRNWAKNEKDEVTKKQLTNLANWEERAFFDWFVETYYHLVPLDGEYRFTYDRSANLVPYNADNKDKYAGQYETREKEYLSFCRKNNLEDELQKLNFCMLFGSNEELEKITSSGIQTILESEKHTLSFFTDFLETKIKEVEQLLTELYQTKVFHEEIKVNLKKNHKLSFETDTGYFVLPF